MVYRVTKSYSRLEKYNIKFWMNGQRGKGFYISSRQLKIESRKSWISINNVDLLFLTSPIFRIQTSLWNLSIDVRNIGNPSLLVATQ